MRTIPIDFKRKLGEVKDEGTIWVLENDCSSLFGEASRKKDEDVLMERVENCEYAARTERLQINGP